MITVPVQTSRYKSMFLQSTLQTGTTKCYTLCVVKDCLQTVLKNHLLTTKIKYTLVCLYGSEMTPCRKRKGRRWIFLKIFSILLMLDTNSYSLFSQMSEIEVCSWDFEGWNLQKFHRGLLIGSMILNYTLVISEEKESLIIDNSATDIYKSLVFINLFFLSIASVSGKISYLVTDRGKRWCAQML